MKQLSRLMVLVGVMLVASNLRAADARPTLSWHFAGTDEVFKSNPESVLSTVSKIKPAGAFGNQIKGRLSTWLPAQLGMTENGWTGGISFIRPLLDELFPNESFGLVVGSDLATSSWAVAIRLDDEGRKNWSSALMMFGRQTKLAEPQELNIAGANGWRMADEGGAKGVSFVSLGEWLVAANNLDAKSAGRTWVEALAKNGRPAAALKEDWLKLAFDPKILKWDLELPVIGDVRRVVASFSWKNEYVRMSADLQLANDVTTSREKWMTPKELILDPLVSFTAVRGVENWIGSFSAVEALPKELRPNQLFSWSRGNVAFVNDVALPVTDPEGAFAILSKSIPKSYNDKIMEYSLGQWISATNMSRLLWRGLPVFVPYLSPQTIDGRGYLVGGIFPLKNKEDAAPAPKALFDQIEGRENLIYYDWEISAARIRAFDQAARFVSLIFELKGEQDGAFGTEWMKLIADKLENAVTEATVTGDREVNIDRKSAVGFTGIELWLLTHWLDGKDFPAFPYNSPTKHGKRPPAGDRPLPVAQPVNH